MRTPHEDLKRQPWDPCPTATKEIRDVYPQATL